MEKKLSASRFSDIDSLYQDDKSVGMIIQDFTGNEVIRGLRFTNLKGDPLLNLTIAITIEQESILKSLLTLGDVNTFIALGTLSSRITNMSSEGISYGIYKLGISCENSTGITEIFPMDDIIVYTLDGRFYHTKEFSAFQHTPKLENSEMENLPKVFI